MHHPKFIMFNRKQVQSNNYIEDIYHIFDIKLLLENRGLSAPWRAGVGLNLDPIQYRPVGS